MARMYETIFSLGGKLTPAFNRMFSQASNRFGNMQSEMNKTSRVGATMANSLKKAGGVLAGAFAVSGIVRVGKDIVNTFATFEQGMANVRAVSGAAGEDFAKLSAKAKEMGAKTSKTAAEAADGLQYLALAGWNTEQMLQGIEPVLRLSEAGALDLGRASDLVTDSMSALGIQVADLPDYLDKVAQTSRRANTNIDALMEGFLVAGGTFKTFNVPLEESNALMGILANRGFKGAQAGTAVNAIVTNLTSGAGAAGKAMKKLNISAFDSQGQFKGMENVLFELKGKMDKMTDAQKAQYISMIAGKEHMKTFTGIMDGLGLEYGDLKEAITGADGALMDMADTQMDTFLGSMTLLDSAIDGVKLQLGEKFAPTIRKIADWITKNIPIAMDIAGRAFNKAGEWLAPVKGVFNTITKLFSGDISGAGFNFAKMLGMSDGDAASIGKGFAGVFSEVMSLKDQFLQGWDNVMPHIKSVMNSGKKIFQQFAPVVAKVAIGVYQAGTKIVRALLPIGQYIGTKLWPIASKVFGFLANDVAPAISRAFSSMVPIFTSVAGKIGQTISAVFTVVKPIIDGLVGAFNFAFPLIKAVVVGAIDTVSGVFKGLMTTLGGILDFVSGVFTGDWSLAWSGIVDTFGGIWAGLKALVAAPINAVIRLVNKAIEGINNVSVDIPDWLGGGTLGFNVGLIPELEGFAKGGIATKPSIFGEAGPEMAIPLNNKPRSHALLDKANQIMGGPSSAASSSPIYITYAPKNYWSGDVSKEKAQEITRMQHDDFEQRMKKYTKQKQRVSFA
ncbi:phage tail tape measure protein [Paenibacillus lautus]|uniref:phage tail tape measure protein n=1 Tax=Paenibacillus lautus TaxID=1401 RepID=UPI003D2E7655